MNRIFWHKVESVIARHIGQIRDIETRHISIEEVFDADLVKVNHLENRVIASAWVLNNGKCDVYKISIPTERSNLNEFEQTFDAKAIIKLKINLEKKKIVVNVCAMH